MYIYVYIHVYIIHMCICIHNIRIDKYMCRVVCCGVLFVLCVCVYDLFFCYRWTRQRKDNRLAGKQHVCVGVCVYLSVCPSVRVCLSVPV